MTPAPKKTLILCAGLQSSGSTLVSYCFLQRNDMNGVLDAENDLLPALDPQLARPIAWYKTTIGCFRLTEMARHYRDAGWRVRPLLVVRDLRDVWASLPKKGYGRNGITAEDPPLRLRVRRFVDDWRDIANRATLFRYEDLIDSPATTLKQVCTTLALPWDEAMLTWPKSPAEIADRGSGNESFWKTRGAGLLQTIEQYRAHAKTPQLPQADLDWLETEFREFNAANGYPLTLSTTATPGLKLHAELAAPSFEVTRRYEWETRRKPIRWLFSRLGWPNQKLIDQRSYRRAA